MPLDMPESVLVRFKGELRAQEDIKIEGRIEGSITFANKLAEVQARFSPAMQVILRALKKYGMFLADNGSAWYLSGAPDTRWDDDDLQSLLDRAHREMLLRRALRREARLVVSPMQV